MTMAGASIACGGEQPLKLRPSRCAVYRAPPVAAVTWFGTGLGVGAKVRKGEGEMEGGEVRGGGHRRLALRVGGVGAGCLGMPPWRGVARELRCHRHACAGKVVTAPPHAANMHMRRARCRRCALR